MKKYLMFFITMMMVVLSITGCGPKPDTTPPAEVTNLTALAENGQVILNWTEPSDQDFAKVSINEANITSVEVSKGTTTKTISDLTNGKEYNFVVKTIDTTGNTSQGAAISTTPIYVDRVAPGEVPSFSGISGDKTIILNWDEPSDADFSGVEITIDSVLYKQITKGTKTETLESLENGKEYSIGIKTFDTSGNFSAGISIKATPAIPEDKTPPGNVTGLTATAGNTQVTLSWTEPADTDFAKVSISGNGITTTEITKGTTSKTFTGLTNNVVYNFLVKSIDTTGNISGGTSVSGTPSGTAPITYTVTFDSKGGSTVSAMTGVVSGAKITAPTNPTKEGYNFGGWYKETECQNTWNFSTDTVTSNRTLYARWTAQTYSITYHLDGGENHASNATEYTYGVGLTLEDPTKTGYTFGGWYSDSGLTETKSVIATDEVGVKEFWAKWLSQNNNLATLSLIEATISPDFSLDINSYTASVANTVTSVTVNAKTADTTATIISRTGVKALNEGSNSLSVVVKAQDGTEKTYTIRVTRAPSIKIYYSKFSNNTIYTASPTEVESEYMTTTNVPTDIAIDSEGNIYYCRSSSYTIHKRTLAGTETDYVTTNIPTSIAIDSAGNIYYSSSSSHIIHKISPTEGESDYVTTTNVPTDIAIDSAGNIYYSRSSSYIIHKISPTVAESNYVTTTNLATDIAIDSAGNIYYSRSSSYIIHKISPTVAESDDESDYITTLTERINGLSI